MSAEPRAALAAFVSALERHLEASSTRRGENDPAVVAAYQDLAEAFDRYDDALMDAYGEVTPLEIYNGDEDDEDDEEFDDEGQPGQYLGLDDEEFDEDSDDEDDEEDEEDDEDEDEEDIEIVATVRPDRH
ncbi:MAG: hypothetical protein IPI32_13860 [Austwickia sp.]|nr:hypothetical protein [Austwickia sp.]MBK8435314.1 hypothetical protein [Austwickia sp.]MBK9101136.1 hypothetical protein [Austwickia sp.]